MIDTSSSDTSTTTTKDTAVDEVGAKDSNVAADTTQVDAGPCHAFWCGCGTCVPTDIICTRSAAGCPLGCPVGACPAMDMSDLCTSSGDRCVRNGIDGPIACLTTADCPPGKCCNGEYAPPGHGTCGAC